MTKQYILKATNVILEQINENKDIYGGMDIALDSTDFCGILNHNSHDFESQCQKITKYIQEKYPHYKTSLSIDTLPPGCIACRYHISISWK